MSDEESRKLFVGGLPSNANKDDVTDYFSKFGEVETCIVKTDSYTQRSRGFAFVILKDTETLNAVLAHDGDHMILDKKVDPKRATPQAKGQQGGAEETARSTKVFVGGIDQSTTKEDLEAVFGTRGTIVDVYLPKDKETGEHKGFAFVNFDDPHTANTLIDEAKIVIGGKECDMKRANSKTESRGRGRGRGGFGGFHQGGYGGHGGGGYDQGYSGDWGNSAGWDQGGYAGGYHQGGGYHQNDSYGGGGGIGAGYPGNYGGGYGADYGNGQGYGGNDHYKMKGGRGGNRGGFQPY